MKIRRADNCVRQSCCTRSRHQCIIRVSAFQSLVLRCLGCRTWVSSSWITMSVKQLLYSACSPSDAHIFKRLWSNRAILRTGFTEPAQAVRSVPLSILIFNLFPALASFSWHWPNVGNIIPMWPQSCMPEMVFSFEKNDLSMIDVNESYIEVLEPLRCSRLHRGLYGGRINWTTIRDTLRRYTPLSMCASKQSTEAYHLNAERDIASLGTVMSQDVRKICFKVAEHLDTMRQNVSGPRGSSWKNWSGRN